MTSCRLALVALWLLLANGASAQTCACGPDFCPDDSRFAAALSRKRASLSAASERYTPALLGLLDRTPRCVAAVERSPDGFSIMEVGAGGDIRVHAWTRPAQDAARVKLAAGELREFRLFHARRRFACCGQAASEDQQDWNAELSLNTGTAMTCRRGVGGAVACE